jgi:hypothetical protein
MSSTYNGLKDCVGCSWLIGSWPILKANSILPVNHVWRWHDTNCILTSFKYHGILQDARLFRNRQGRIGLQG